MTKERLEHCLFMAKAFAGDDTAILDQIQSDMDQRVKEVEHMFSESDKETGETLQVEAEFQIYSDRQ